MTRVRVSASSTVVRAGLEALVRADARFVVVPSTGAGPPAWHVRDTDVLLMEVAEPDMLARLPAVVPADGPAIVLLADHLGRRELRRALQAGVRAVIPRDAGGVEIGAAIEGAAAGLTVLSSDDLDALLPLGAPTELQSNTQPGEPLTARETEVLTMMAEGLANKEIAARLQISEHTVKFHVSSILAKLGATSRGEAVAHGVRGGLIVI